MNAKDSERPGKDANHPLPKPNAEMALSGSRTEFTLEQIRGFLCNPIYAGIGPYPQLIADEQWIRCAVNAIRDEGPEQFLVNMLHLLRKAFERATLDP